MPIKNRTDAGSDDLADPEVRIWRFLGVHKFLNMLVSKKVYFTQLARLCTDDPYEGWYETPDYPELPEGYRFPDITAQNLYVSCWHKGNSEPAGLWKIYSEPYGGLAVETSLDRIKKAFEATSEIIVIGEIKYGNDFGDVSNGHAPAFRKRSNFEYESEVRLSYCPQVGGISSTSKNLPDGIPIDCDLQALINRIVVGPKTDQWMLETIRNLVSQLGFEFSVSPSSLLARPQAQ